jgi:hypothetical protein
MARQDQVRALLPRERVDDVVRTIRAELEDQGGSVEVTDAAPGRYRDERPDLELRGLVQAGRFRGPVGAAVGALVGLALALLVPALREWAPWTTVLLAFGGAWGGTAVAAARAVQVTRDEGDRGEVLLDVDEARAAQLAVLTVRDVRDRGPVVDLLVEQDARLLDSAHPEVGHDRPGARPASDDDDLAGPPAR